MRYSSEPITEDISEIRKLLKEISNHVINLVTTGKQLWITEFGNEENTKYKSKEYVDALGFVEESTLKSTNNTGNVDNRN
mgnify:CR=1 FL=1